MKKSFRAFWSSERYVNIIILFITSMTHVCIAGLASLVDFNKILKNLDQKDEQIEGLNATSSKLKEYNTIGHPYMRDYCISPEMSYQFITSLFMSSDGCC